MSAPKENSLNHWKYRLLEKDRIPDWIIRRHIRKLSRERLRTESRGGSAGIQERQQELLKTMQNGPIALTTEAANEQHYEVPAEFFRLVLGPQLKYSCAWWPAETDDLAKAEEEMLKLYAERAELKDGQTILELGCGWGSLSLFLAKNYPNSQILAVSNSKLQKDYIDRQIKAAGINNLKVETQDMNQFSPAGSFDRILSIEMFEHMRNWQHLFEKIEGWLQPDGKFFLHIFTHRQLSYPFEVRDEDDWMAKYFFTGGMMPSRDLPLVCKGNLETESQWHLSGIHYQKTAEAWLKNMDRQENPIKTLFASHYGTDEAVKWWVYWRVFFMACAEVWGLRAGDEWGVSHYLFSKQNSNSSSGRH